MKIEGPRGPGAAGSARKPGAAGAGGFVLPANAPAPPASVARVQAASVIDGVLALQVEADPRRRARQVRRGHFVLDALERLALAHLEGAAPGAARLSLAALAAETEPTGDPGLDGALADIDVRAAVEMAKLEMAERT